MAACLFFHNHENWDTIRERLKQMACPHCTKTGMLIGHGVLRGYDDQSPQRKTLRAHRVFCSNRNQRTGCGRTFSIWLADKLRRLSVTTRTLGNFLQRVVADGMTCALRAVHSFLSDRTWQRHWARFRNAQAAIRTQLAHRGTPPKLSSPRPEAEVFAHLHAAFPHADCPLAAYQQATRTFFL